MSRKRQTLAPSARLAATLLVLVVQIACSAETGGESSSTGGPADVSPTGADTTLVDGGTTAQDGAVFDSVGSDMLEPPADTGMPPAKDVIAPDTGFDAATDDVVGPDTHVPDVGADVQTTPENNCVDDIDNDNNGQTDCDDEACAFDTECTPSCAPIAAIACEETIAGNTGAQQAANVLAEYSCIDGFHTGPEVAWSFTVTQPTWVLAELQNETDQTNLMVVEGVDGACFSNKCVVGDNKDVFFLATPGEPLFFVVDGLEGDSGTFNLALTCEVCTPDCTSKVCGDDSCGGTCGACGDGVCSVDGSVCLQSVTGDTCSDAVVVDTLPYNDSGTTLGAIDDISALGDGCDEAGFSGGADVVYAFTPPETANYLISLNNINFDGALYVIGSCLNSQGTCFGGADTPGDESLEIGLAGSSTYYIVVDGIDELESGTFDLAVSKLGSCSPNCGACGEADGCGGVCPCTPVDNDTCADAVEINPGALPITLTGTTDGGNDDYAVDAGSCPGAPGYGFGQGGADVVFSVTPTVTGSFTFEIPQTDDGYDASIFVVTDCSAIQSSCVGGAEVEGAGGESMTVVLNAQTTYFVIVDGYKADLGDFELQVSQCVPSCSGKSCGNNGCGGTCGECPPGKGCITGACVDVAENGSCETASIIESLPFTATSTTVGLSDASEVWTDECGQPFSYLAGSATPDAMWRFVPTQTGIYSVTVTALEEWAPFVTITSSCLEPGNGCAAVFDAGQVQHVELTAMSPVYFIVDGDPGEGAFTLDVDACTPQCDGKSCGNNGCGGSCGTCDGTDICLTGSCVASTDCLGVSFEGCCSEETLLYCDEGELVALECSADGTCGWDPDSDWYACGFEGGDPDGTHPLECTQE